MRSKERIRNRPRNPRNKPRTPAPTVDRQVESHRSATRDLLKIALPLFAVMGAMIVSPRCGDPEPQKEKVSQKDKEGESPSYPGPSRTENPRNNYNNSDATQPKIHPTPIEHPDLHGDNIEQMIALQNHWKKIAEDALGIFEKADPRIPELQRFILANAFYSLPMGPVTTQRIMKGRIEDFGKNPNEFEIVFMPERYATNMKSSILTEPGGRTVRIATSFKCKEWLGIMLAHELSHVEDGIIHKENSFDKNQYLAGEVRAHLLEMKLLKSWDPEVYRTFIEKGTPLFMSNDRQELFHLISSLYPVNAPLVSEMESSLAGASVLVSLAFEIALKDGKSEKDLEQVYDKLTKVLSGQDN